MDRFRLYRVNMKYIRDLSKVDDNVASVSPQIGKQLRPFVGLVIVAGDRSYCVPLASPKPKHAHMKNSLDFSKILDSDGKLIGALNFNNMIPVDASVLIRFSIDAEPGDDAEARAYKSLMRDQLDWCNANREIIVRKVNKLYRLVTEHPETARSLVKRCCDFRKLEGVLEKRQGRIRVG